MQASKILVVEDEVIVAKDIEQKLARMGHEVIAIAMSGEDAVDIALHKKPDLILMDIKLQGQMDGVEAAAQIHARVQIPLIFLTALNDEQTLQRAKVTEPFGYIQKPITSRELHIAVEIGLYKHTVQKELSMQLQRMTAMRLIDQAIITGKDLHWTMRVILHQIAVQLEVDAVAVLLVSPYTGSFEYFQTYGFRSASYNNFHQRGDTGFIARVLRTGERLRIENLRETSEQDTRLPWMLSEQFHAYVLIPLYSRERLIGLLEVFHRTHLEINREWADFLDMLCQQVAIAVENTRLMDELTSVNVEILQSYNATIAGLSSALELRDNETRGHSQRVTELTVRIARQMGLDGDQLEHIRRGSLLHDIGKMGIPDNILLKPGSLTPEEWEIMRRHPSMAQEMLSSVPFLRPALEIPFYHHERWDGSGYPMGLKGEKIPLAARIFAVADVWDALLSDRPYRQAWPRDQVVEYMQKQSGVLFDPTVVGVFLRMLGHMPDHSL